MGAPQYRQQEVAITKEQWASLNPYGSPDSYPSEEYSTIKDLEKQWARFYEYLPWLRGPSGATGPAGPAGPPGPPGPPRPPPSGPTPKPPGIEAASCGATTLSLWWSSLAALKSLMCMIWKLPFLS